MIEKFIKDNENRARALTERYVLHAFIVSSPTQPKHKLGYEQPKICRYCGKDESMTTFREESHAIPIFLGNKTIICAFHAIRPPSPPTSGHLFHAHPARQSERSDAGLHC